MSSSGLLSATPLRAPITTKNSRRTMALASRSRDSLLLLVPPLLLLLLAVLLPVTLFVLEGKRTLCLPPLPPLPLLVVADW